MKNEKGTRPRKWRLEKMLYNIPSLIIRGIFALVPMIMVVWIIWTVMDVTLGIFAPIIELATKHIPAEYDLMVGIGIVLTIVALVGILSSLLDRGLLKIFKFQWIKIRNALYRAVLKAKGRGMVVVVKPYGDEGAEELGIFMELVEENHDGQNIVKAKVFIPGAPVPITGMVRLLTLCKVWETNLTIDDFIRQITSFGLAPIGKKLITRRLDTIPLQELLFPNDSPQESGAKS